MRRLVLESDQSFEEQLTASVNESWEWCHPSTVPSALGRICISVADEQAVDSYNQSFECSIHLRREQAIKLRDWLSEALDGRTA